MKAFCWLTVSAVALMSAGAAQAQTAATTTDPAPAAQADAPVDHSNEIVVTAERRSTSLQRTGVAAGHVEDLRRAVVGHDQATRVLPLAVALLAVRLLVGLGLDDAGRAFARRVRAARPTLYVVPFARDPPAAARVVRLHV